MTTQLSIARLITNRQADLHITAGELIKRAGYRSTSGGVRRLANLCHGDLGEKTRFLRDGLPTALDLPPDQVKAAIEATRQQLAEAERAMAEEEERRYRERFEPHGIWSTEFARPSSIVMAAFYGIPRLFKIDLDAEKGEETYVAQSIAAMPSSIPFFGKATGFIINFTPDHAVQYDREGNVAATFSKAQRLPEADVTLQGDNHSILPLFGVEVPKD